MAIQILDLDVGQVMVKNVVKVKQDIDIKQVALLLKQKGIGCVMVTDGTKPIGILTERDIIHKVVAPNVDPEKLNASDIMTRTLITITPYHAIEEAADLMKEKNIKKLPVMEDNRLVGIVTMTDLLRIMRSIEKGMLKRLMKRRM